MFLFSKPMPLLYFKEISSTNNYIKENLFDFQQNFSGIYSFNQTKGKGQKANDWLCEPQQNIALTFCLTDDLIKINNISFWVPIIIRNYLEKITQKKVCIKWPNDILIEKKKVCGILIEKSKNTFIIGIGINVLQKDFTNLPKASSLSLVSPKDYNLEEICTHLVTDFKNNLNLLSNGHLLKELYNAHLFGKDKIMAFKFNNIIQNGIIKYVDGNGLLGLELENEKIKKFRIKEIELLY